jgi:hypothetical protein
MLNVVMLNVVILDVVMLNIVMLNAVILNVVGPCLFNFNIPGIKARVFAPCKTFLNSLIVARESQVQLSIGRRLVIDLKY